MKITDKVIRKIMHHEVSCEKMWWYWTTSEGLKSFFCESSRIEITPLGAYEIYFSMDWPEGNQWDAVYDYFDQAWSYVFDKLSRVSS